MFHAERFFTARKLNEERVENKWEILGENVQIYENENFILVFEAICWAILAAEIIVSIFLTEFRRFGVNL